MEVNGCNKFDPCGLKSVKDDDLIFLEKSKNIVKNVSNNMNALKLINYILE